MQIELKVPPVGESITEVEIGQWLKNEGDSVSMNDNLVSIESEKTTLELPAPASGALEKILKRQGEVAKVGDVIGILQQDGTGVGKETKRTETPKAEPLPPPAQEQKEARAQPEQRVMPAAARILAEHGMKAESIQGTGPGGRVLKEDVLKYAEGLQKEKAAPAAPLAAPPRPPATTAPSAPSPVTVPTEFRQEQVVPMTRLRKTLAERLVQAQQTAALLTTFNEVDMTEVLNLRKQYQEQFTQKYGVKLGFMSFFVKASIEALRSIPQVNAEIRGTDIVYRNYFDIGVAVGGGRGLVVPVLRNAERMSFAQVEMAIAELAKRAKENKLTLEELQGGTFTISNGGIYGSLLSTPIINPPQSGILGMHAMQERPIALNGQVVIRPMMYIALTYDHRVVDGREAVTFLKRIKEVIENPARILLEV
jgi:2-oxoglutarate dehydrogenase E2 component (dihydrolipoamide succinyltransferase)